MNSKLASIIDRSRLKQHALVCLSDLRRKQTFSLLHVVISDAYALWSYQRFHPVRNGSDPCDLADHLYSNYRLCSWWLRILDDGFGNSDSFPAGPSSDVNAQSSTLTPQDERMHSKRGKGLLVVPNLGIPAKLNDILDARSNRINIIARSALMRGCC